MTKLYIALLFTVTFFNSSYAQWAYNGNHIVNQNSGYVGIGTNVPASPLEVQGSSNGWLLNLRAIAANAGEINGIKFNSGYLADNKWAGISSVAEDVHSNNTGLVLFANAAEKISGHPGADHQHYADIHCRACRTVYLDLFYNGKV